MKLCASLKRSSSDTDPAFIDTHNKKASKGFAGVPYNERIVLVPHCLRNHEKCRAKDMGSYYVCAECGQCTIDVISKTSKQLGYCGIYILKGGRTTEKLIKGAKPRALLGIACLYEGKMGIELAKKHSLEVVCVPLTKDGCANTDVDLDEVIKVMEKK